MSAPRAAAQPLRMAVPLGHSSARYSAGGDGAARHPYHRAKHILRQREERARERRAAFIGFPLSLALSPLLRRGAREFTALCRVSHSLLSKCGWIHWPARIKSRRRFRSSNEMLLLLSMVIQLSKVTDRITPDSLREMANPLRPTGNCFSIGLIDGTLRLHASGPSLILPGLRA